MIASNLLSDSLLKPTFRHTTHSLSCRLQAEWMGQEGVQDRQGKFKTGKGEDSGYISEKQGRKDKAAVGSAGQGSRMEDRRGQCGVKYSQGSQCPRLSTRKTDGCKLAIRGLRYCREGGWVLHWLLIQTPGDPTHTRESGNARSCLACKRDPLGRSGSTAVAWP